MQAWALGRAAGRDMAWHGAARASWRSSPHVRSAATFGCTHPPRHPRPAAWHAWRPAPPASPSHLLLIPLHLTRRPIRGRGLQQAERSRIVMGQRRSCMAAAAACHAMQRHLAQAAHAMPLPAMAWAAPPFVHMQARASSCCTEPRPASHVMPCHASARQLMPRPCHAHDSSLQIATGTHLRSRSA